MPFKLLSLLLSIPYLMLSPSYLAYRLTLLTTFYLNSLNALPTLSCLTIDLL